MLHICLKVAGPTPRLNLAAKGRVAGPTPGTREKRSKGREASPH